MNQFMKNTLQGPRSAGLCAALLAVVVCLFLLTPAQAASPLSATYAGVWEDSGYTSDYATRNIDLSISQVKGQTAYVEASSTYFHALMSTKENFDATIGRLRSSLVEGTVTFNASGVATLKYKDEYNNGVLKIVLNKGRISLSWTGEEIGEYSFLPGSYTLYKKVNLSEAERAKLGLFLSNFTELGLYKLDSAALKPADLIRFGIWHNYINNYKSAVSDTKGGKLFISRETVSASIRKYFNLPFTKHATVGEYQYNGKGYVFTGADGEAPVYVKVHSVYQTAANQYKVQGSMYNPDSSDEAGYGWVIATVNKITENGKSRYVLGKIDAR
ncbi:hypothetical protein [Paenibacillus sp. MMS20-IR301]|uniref:hypothetical protein n=1 Tax=Paenibacillus sp. MMS20-IR301 TaxID=2895946 RepID=UPI0028EF601A|nr:hypothetical protein [Paenibacillus sp. MMS20-IR301]WNS46702.1 hypothetical protein LOS79_16060 [Paenibacillus sp. MMS20-IR301]